MTQTLIKGIDHTGICVITFCHDGKGQFLIAKRSKHTRDEHGKWDIGGGGLEFHDTVENTIHKEIKEEYSTDVLGYEFLGYRDVHRMHQGKPTHWVSLDFKVHIERSKTAIGEPHMIDELRWISKDDLPPTEDLHSQFPHFISRYSSQLFGL